MIHLNRRWMTLLFASVGLLVLIFLYWNETQKILSVSVNVWTDEQAADCAVVLTGGAGRVREGIDLLARGKVRKLIISGTHPKAQFEEIFPMWPFYPEVSKKDVYLERISTTTYGNARQAQPLVDVLLCRDIILVTSQYHMYRATRTFKEIFEESLPIYPRAIPERSYSQSIGGLIVESSKSLFYSIWAY